MLRSCESFYESKQDSSLKGILDAVLGTLEHVHSPEVLANCVVRGAKAQKALSSKWLANMNTFTAWTLYKLQFLN